MIENMQAYPRRTSHLVLPRRPFETRRAAEGRRHSRSRPRVPSLGFCVRSLHDRPVRFASNSSKSRTITGNHREADEARMIVRHAGDERG